MAIPDAAYFRALLEDDPEQLYERAPCGYLSAGGDGTIWKVNLTFLAMTGYARDELVGVRRFADLLTVGGRIYHETHFAPMLHGAGTAREIALDVLARDGRVIPVLVNAVADVDARGRADVIRIAVLDATHRREYERALLSAKQHAETAEATARSLARTLQQTLIPPTPPTIRGLDVATEYRPAGDGTEVGGDFFDVFQVGVREWVVTMGDVCGKGAAAAVVTALARYTLRAAAFEEVSPAAALRLLNTVLLRYPTERFCTAVVLRMRQSGDEWRGAVSSGGHPLPLVRTVARQVRTIGSGGTLLGVFDDVHLRDTDIVLTPGDTAVLFTDGLTEGRRGTEFFGDERVRRILAAPHSSAASVVATLLGEVLGFQSGHPRDDIALAAFRALPG